MDLREQVAEADGGCNCSGSLQCCLLYGIYLCIHSSVIWLFFQVDGFDKDGFPLKRISPTAIAGQSPGKV